MLPARFSNRAALAVLAWTCVTGGLVACGDDGGKPVDAMIDGTPPPDSQCGADALVTGETIDWDATSAAFCGVFNTTATVRGDATRTIKTNPNGRFVLCVAHQAETVVELAPAGVASECATKPGTYNVGGIVLLEKPVVDANLLPSVRMITDERITTMYAAGTIGVLNQNQAQIVVHMTGAPRAVTLSTANTSAAQQWNGTKWEPVEGAAAQGNDVLYANVDTSGGPVTVMVNGGTPSTVTLTPNTATPAAATLIPGKFTYVTVVTP